MQLIRAIPFLLIAVCVLAACDRNASGGLAPLRDLSAREVGRDIPENRQIPVGDDDDIFTIANRYDVLPQYLAAANNLTPPNYDISGRRTLTVPRVEDYDSIDLAPDRGTPQRAGGTRRGGNRNAAATATTRSQRGTTVTSAASPQVRLVPKQNTAPAATGSNAVRFSASARDFTWPVDGAIISRYGNAGRGIHNDGVNIAAAPGDPVRASYDGEVGFVGLGLKAFGNMILVKHRDGWVTAYAHLGEVTVAEGAKIKRGDVIGYVGQSGKVTSPQLHFELRDRTGSVNPEEYLS